MYERPLDERSEVGWTKSGESPNAHVCELAALDEARDRARGDPEFPGDLFAGQEQPPRAVEFLLMTVHATQHARRGAAGPVSPGMNPGLRLATGAPDDARGTLRPDDGELYRLAEQALAEQDEWSDERHRGFWDALLPLWPPPPGTVPRAERMDALTGALLTFADAFEWDRGYVADVLSLAPDSLRRMGYGRGDRCLGWWPGTGDRRARLPQVHHEDEAPPEGLPAVTARPPESAAVAAVGSAAREALRQEARKRWKSPPALLAVLALSGGAVSTVLWGLPGEQGDGASVYAVAETAAGHIAYDPVAVAIGEEWPIAPPPAGLSPWEPLSDRAAAALMERAGAALTAPDEARLPSAYGPNTHRYPLRRAPP